MAPKKNISPISVRIDRAQKPDCELAAEIDTVSAESGMPVTTVVKKAIGLGLPETRRILKQLEPKPAKP